VELENVGLFQMVVFDLQGVFELVSHRYLIYIFGMKTQPIELMIMFMNTFRWLTHVF